jgi:uncharacterized protein YxeA
MKTSIIIIAIIIIAVIIVGAFAAMSMNTTSTPQTTYNITEKGTKLNLKNNNTQLWSHMDIVIENVTVKNGSKQNFYLEAWVKPGENLTIDLSSLFGYGNERLPANYTIKPLIWGALFKNGTNATGNSTFNMTLNGWSNTLNPPSNDPYYNITHDKMPIMTLPPKVTSNMFYYNNTIPGIDAITRANYPHDDINEIIFTVITMTVNAEGNIEMNFTVPPTLCSTIAHIISV